MDRHLLVDLVVLEEEFTVLPFQSALGCSR